MYDRYLSALKQDIRLFKSAEKALQYLDDQITNLVSLRTEFNKQLREEEKSDEDAGNFALNATRKQVVKILTEEALNALGRRKEFNTTSFRKGLIKAIENQETYSLSISPSSGNLIIKIDLNKTAGDLSDYANAVEETRRKLRVGPYRTGTNDKGKTVTPLDPELASHMWEEKYYKPAREGTTIPTPKTKSGKESKRKINIQNYIAKYWKTIHLRQSLFKKSAPWWEILNYGTTPLASDYGGISYPQTSPTRFVEKAIKKIKARYNEEFSATQEIISNIKKEIISLDKAIQFCEYKIQRIAGLLGKDTRRTSVADIREFALEEIKKSLKSRWSYASMERVEILIDKLIAGEEIKEERFELTARGAEKRARARYERLRKIIQKYKGQEK